jgi:hypothetical protein
MFKDSCGSECFLPEFEFCCGDQIYPQTKENPANGGMPSPLYCCTDSNGKEYSDFSCDQNATTAPVVPLPADDDCGMFRDSCGAECFLPEFEFCCGDSIFPQTKEDPARGGMPAPLFCCTDANGKEYTSFSCDQAPATAAVLPAPEVRLDDDCGMFKDECGNECFLPEFEFCCGDAIFPQTKENPSNGGMPSPLYCCTDANGKEFVSFSCDQTPTTAPVVVLPAPEIRLDDDCGMFEMSCGTTCFMPEIEFCCGDSIYPQSKADPARGNQPFPQYCCTDANGKEYTAFSCN